MANQMTGRIVHYVVTEGRCQAAIVVKQWSEECLNLTVFPDWSNDQSQDGVVWRTSVTKSDAKIVGSWHLPTQCQ